MTLEKRWGEAQAERRSLVHANARAQARPTATSTCPILASNKSRFACMHDPTHGLLHRCSSTSNCTGRRCAYSPVSVSVPRICNRSCARGRADMRLSQPSLLSTAAPRRGPLWCPRSANVQSPCVMPALLAALTWRTPRRVAAHAPPPCRPLMTGPLREDMSEAEVTVKRSLTAQVSVPALRLRPPSCVQVASFCA